MLVLSGFGAVLFGADGEKNARFVELVAQQPAESGMG
jgi:hypothetical protein